MGKELFAQFPEAQAVFEAADDALGEKLSTTCFEGPEERLRATATTQPAILVTSIAAHAVFARRGPAPTFVAGHSLGEYSALVAAGALGLADAVRAVRARGTFMQEAVPEGVGAMAAVLGLAPEQVKAVCEACAEGQVLQPANYNEPAQTVIAGHAAAVERATQKLKDAGAKRVLPLAVSAPFHCPLMQPVVPRLREVLDRATFRAPSVPVVTNVEAKPCSDPERLRALLLEQVTAPVRWVECIEALAQQGVTHLVELGPGRVLSGLVRRINPAMECYSVDGPARLEIALTALSSF